MFDKQELSYILECIRCREKEIDFINDVLITDSLDYELSLLQILKSKCQSLALNMIK